MSDTQVRRFVLDLWPDDENETPEGLLRFALDVLGASNKGLIWDIQDESGNILHENVCLLSETRAALESEAMPRE